MAIPNSDQICTVTLSIFSTLTPLTQKNDCSNCMRGSKLPKKNHHGNDDSKSSILIFQVDSVGGITCWNRPPGAISHDHLLEYCSSRSSRRSPHYMTLLAMLSE